MSPSEIFVKLQMQRELQSAEGFSSYYLDRAQHQHDEAIQKLQATMEEHKGDNSWLASEEGKRVTKDLQKMKTEYNKEIGLAASQSQQAHMQREQIGRLQDVGTYAVEKAADSYSELGVAAMKETHNRGLTDNPIHVGPELGWPTFYGSHPKEFVELIKKSREMMAQKLVEEGMSQREAQDEARRHIKGELDTSHLGMFFEHFRPDEKDMDKRIKEFNNWFIDQVKFIAKENKENDILGGVQIVNSAATGHAHLPPSQGIFPVIEAAKILKEQGNFNGQFTSEGHEEEKFERGRILFDAWAHLAGQSMAPSYLAGTRMGGGLGGSWVNPQSSYFGRAYSPMQMFGEYSPNQEFKLWSEVPLE
jgi:hypothetical protein